MTVDHTYTPRGTNRNYRLIDTAFSQRRLYVFKLSVHVHFGRINRINIIKL